MSERISMRKIKEILRLRWDMARTYREISRSVNVSTSTISECIRRAKHAGLTWPLPKDLDDEQLESLLYLPVRNHVSESDKQIDWLCPYTAVNSGCINSE